MPEGDLARLRADRVALGLLAFAALVRALFLAQVFDLGLELRGRVNLDAYNYHRRAVRIVEGDVLGRERFDFSGRWPDEPGHPRSSFAIEILGEKRYDETFGPRVYFDYPGYPYFLASFYAMFGEGGRSVLVAQEALDLLGCALVYLIALRLRDRTVARVALGLAAAWGPLVFYAGFVLRDSVLAFLGTAIVYLGARRSWLVCGVVFGLAWIVKGSLVFFLPPIALALGRRPREIALFIVGALLGVSPVAARNVALGVSPLRVSTVEEASLVMYNQPAAGTRQQVYDFPAARGIADGCPEVSSLAMYRAAVAAHASKADYLGLVATRLLEHVRADDAFDNVRFSYLGPGLLSLSLAPVRFKLVLGFVAIGLVLALLSPRESVLLFGPLLATLAMAALAMALTRYRLHADPIHAILAAHGAVWLVREARRRRAHAIYAALGSLALTLALHDPVPPPTPQQRWNYIAGTFGLDAATRLVR
ncbi:MAG TPA: glycosyltransferase family 39 protein [Planctomycetota bacterium]|nr:glycosyltransferase family 39 protein [Planctomycetota bacterium]